PSNALCSLSLHDALPICLPDVIRNQLDADAWSGGEDHRALDDVLELAHVARPVVFGEQIQRIGGQLQIALAVLFAVLLQKMVDEDRKSTRLNSSHDQISY